MTSDSVILEDGTTILSRAIVEKLKRLLEAARVRIQIPLTPVETYQREARSIFLRKCITDKVYIELFNSKACSLLVLLLTYPLDNTFILKVNQCFKEIRTHKVGSRGETELIWKDKAL